MSGRSESDLDRIFELSLDLLAIGSMGDGHFTKVSRSFVRTFGHSAESMVARPFFELIHPDDRAATATAYDALVRGAAVIGFTNRYRCADGSYRWIEWLAMPADGLLYGVGHDVTDRRSGAEAMAAQGRNVQAAKLAALGQLVAGVAHEINNPLSFVSNNLAVLERDLGLVNQLLALHAEAVPVLEAAAPELAARVRATAEAMDLSYLQANLPRVLARSRDGLRRIQQLVKDLRDFARLDEGARQLVDLNDCIRSTVNIMRGAAKANGLDIELDLGPLPRLSCFPTRIGQVVMNLVANAIDASPDGGAVTVHSRAGEGVAVVEVIDRGQGIAPEVLARMYEPFFTTKPQGEGTGLGLSITQRIVKDHGGTIAVETEVGRGTRFVVTLPR